MIIGYLNRCQAMLQRGLPVADVLVYVGDHAPNVPGRKQAAPGGILPGFDFDWCNEDALLHRITAKDGLLVLPDGVSYRVLVLPDHAILSLAVARKLREFVQAGVAITGPKPRRTASLSGWPDSETELKAIAGELWQDGRIATSTPAAELLAKRGIPADVAWTSGTLDWVHRRDGDADIYFLSNQAKVPVNTDVTFRSHGRQPELWNPLTGGRRDATAFSQANGQTLVPISLDPCGSIFVVFRKPITTQATGTTRDNEDHLAETAAVAGPWTVAFDPAWGGPATTRFETLADWTRHPDAGIRNYSGTAIYQTTFGKPAGDGPFVLDLGNLAEMATVSVPPGGALSPRAPANAERELAAKGGRHDWLWAMLSPTIGVLPWRCSATWSAAPWRRSEAPPRSGGRLVRQRFSRASERDETSLLRRMRVANRGHAPSRPRFGAGSASGSAQLISGLAGVWANTSSVVSSRKWRLDSSSLTNSWCNGQGAPASHEP